MPSLPSTRAPSSSQSVRDAQESDEHPDPEGFNIDSLLTRPLETWHVPVPVGK